MADITPLIAVHATAASLATLTGPVALWGRLGAKARPRLHRAFGYAWVTLMLITAVSALFITAAVGPVWRGFGLIHLLAVWTLLALFGAFRFLLQGNIKGHRQTMIYLYIGACLVSGAFTFAPGRLMHGLLMSVLA